jgi:hypothetical protein
MVRKMIVAGCLCFASLYADVYDLSQAHDFFRQSGYGKDCVRFRDNGEDFRAIMQCSEFYATADPNIASICIYIDIYNSQGSDEAYRYLSGHKGASSPFAREFSLAISRNDKTVADLLDDFARTHTNFRHLWSSRGPGGGIGAAIITTVLQESDGRDIRALLEKIKNS